MAVLLQLDVRPHDAQVALVWSDGEPTGLRCVHQSVLYVGGHGVLVGNELGASSMAELALARGEHPLQVFVDAEATRDVSRVVFALAEPGITKRTDTADA